MACSWIARYWFKEGVCSDVIGFDTIEGAIGFATGFMYAGQRSGPGTVHVFANGDGAVLYQITWTCDESFVNDMRFKPSERK